MVVSLLIFGVGLGVGLVLPVDIFPRQISTYVEQRNQSGYKFINPLVDCDAANFAQSASLDSLKDQLSPLVSDQTSVYFRDLNNGPWIGLNEDRLFSPASLVKVPILITYYKAAQDNPDLLNQTIKTPPTQTDNQNIDPAVTLTASQQYTVNELLNRMIIYSDNEAYDLLSNYIDNRLIVKTFTDLDIDISRGFTDPTGNIISVKNYASFFRILFNASYLNKDMSEKALSLLTRVDYKDGLVRGVNNPKITIAHKFGERKYEDTGEEQLHDCGIVYLPNKPYLLCIMSRGTDFTNLSATIAKISSVVYQSLTSKN